MTEQLDEVVSVSGRRRRRDAGKVKILARDAAALQWILDMRAVADSDLAVLLGRLSTDPKKKAEALAADSTLRVVGRWESLGLVEWRRVLFEGPRIVTLTAKGVDLIAPGAHYQPPRLATLQHALEVGRVRLHLEGKHGAAARWVTEQQWRADHREEIEEAKRVSRTFHSPDGELVLNGSRWLIEVELTAKAPARLEVILTALLRRADYDRVQYYCAPEAIGVVQSVAAVVAPRFAGQAAPKFWAALLPRLRSAVAA